MQCGRDGVVVGRIRERGREKRRKAEGRETGAREIPERSTPLHPLGFSRLARVYVANRRNETSSSPPREYPFLHVSFTRLDDRFPRSIIFKLVSRGKNASSFSRFSSLLFLLFLLVFLFFSSGVGEGERDVFVEVIDKARLELYHSLEERYGGYLL